MIRAPRSSTPRVASVPAGATLVEVLMALLIMSIGIVSVITMFPIAVLRSIQATQLTNSKLMTQNAEQSFRAMFGDTAISALGTSMPVSYGILDYHDVPVVDVNAPTAPRFRGFWQPGTAYTLGQIVTPTRPNDSFRPAVEPWMICTQPGISGAAEPRWETGSPDIVANEGTDLLGNPRPQWVSWYDPTAIPLPNPRRVGGPANYVSVISLPYAYNDGVTSFSIASTFYNARNYVFDPLGWATFNSDYLQLFNNSGGTAPSPNDFGYTYSKATGLAQAIASRPFDSNAANATGPFILRMNGGASTIAAAEALATHPDSWAVEVQPVTLLSSLAVAPFAGLRTATFPIPTDLSAITIGDCRIVLTSLTKDETYVRDISTVAPATRTVGWDEPLPIGFVPDGQCRIERRDRRFTWLATVNRDYEGHTRVTIVTFFKRGLKPEEEHAYGANVGLPTATGPYDQIAITWNAATDPPPLIREGNYLFDAINVKWYRIVAVTTSGTTAAITVDRPVPLAHRTTSGRIILMRGIVELFEITL